MRWSTLFCNLFIILCLSWVTIGKSIENEEEKTNEINEEVQVEVTVSTVSSVTGDSEAQTEGKVETDEEGKLEGEEDEPEEGEDVDGEEEGTTTGSVTERATTEATTTEEPSVTTEPGTTVEPTTREPEECNPDIYCQAELLPMKLIFNKTFIMCDQDIKPRDRCCLPHGPHLVCYNIMVDAQHLNYDVAVAQLSTDIYSLCSLLVKSQDKVQGQYTAASIEDGEGTQVYAYNEFKTLTNVNTEKPQHIKDLACQIIKN